MESGVVVKVMLPVNSSFTVGCDDLEIHVMVRSCGAVDTGFLPVQGNAQPHEVKVFRC